MFGLALRRQPDAFDCAFEAHQPANQRVVARVSGIGVLEGEPIVEAPLGIRKRRLRYGNPGKSQARRANRDEKGLHRLPARRQVGESFFDEVATRKRLVAHVPILAVHGGGTRRGVQP